jgi:aldose 1-epimerase
VNVAGRLTCHFPWTTAAPSGRQFEIARGDERAVVVEVGGGLREYAAMGRPVVHGYGEDEMCSAGRGQLLMPWPNRVRDGRYAFAGREHRLPLTEPERGNAIHGLVRWAAWSVAVLEPDRVVMRHRLHPQPGYPFLLDLEVEYHLPGDGLRVRTTARNVGSEPCPFGAGAHPYLTVGTPRVDDAVLRAPGGTVLLADGRGLPTGTGPVEGTDLDFRRPRPVGSTRLDHCFTDLQRDPDGLARVEMRHPEGTPGLTLWMDRGHTHLMLFTGDALPQIGRRGLAVEPMTCPPDALRSGRGLITLEPGRSWTGEWGISPLPHNGRWRTP